MLRFLTLAVLLAPALAHADQAAGDACAASLTGDPQTIYAAVAATYAAGDWQTDPKATIASLAQTGQIDQSVQRLSAMTAAPCLKQWVQGTAGDSTSVQR